MMKPVATIILGLSLFSCNTVKNTESGSNRQTADRSLEAKDSVALQSPPKSVTINGKTVQPAANSVNISTGGEVK